MIDERAVSAATPVAPRRVRAGAMNARERLEALFDPGSFVEWGAAVEPAPQLFGPQPEAAAGDGVLTGSGRIDGRLAFAFSQDYTVLEGTLGERGARKIVDLLDRAADAGAPVVALLHSNGARLTEGLGSLEGASEVFHRLDVYHRRIPIVAVAMGFCAGFSAYLASLSHLVVMVDRTSFLVTTSPAVIRQATSQRVRLPELGGARMHSEVSGVAHMLAGNEPEALAMAREAVGYLAQEGPRPSLEPVEPLPALPSNPAHAYDVLPMLRGLADDSRLLEVWPRWGKSVVTAFGRLGGRPVGFVANQPIVESGAVTTKSARKMSQFVQLCDTFGLPLVFLVDVPGILPGVEPEREGILFEGAQFYRAICTDVPRISVVTRKCYGGAYGLLHSKVGGGTLVLAYPQARIGVVGSSIALQILGAETSDPAERAALAADWEARGESAAAAAARGVVDRLIAPERTREELLAALALSASRAKTSRLRRSGWDA